MMKKIKIQNYSEPRPESHYTRDKKYWVWLGNGAKRSFTNRKHAEAFLAQTNRFLNEKVFELNRLYAEIFAEYRRIWFLMDGRIAYADDLDRTLEWTNKKFNLMMENSAGANGNYFAFTNMRVIISYLHEVLNALQDTQKLRNNWVEKHNLAVIAARLDAVKRDVDGYDLAAEQD